MDKKDLYIVNIINIETTGLEESPFAKNLAALRAHEARYFKNKYNINYITKKLYGDEEILTYVNNFLSKKGLIIESKPLVYSDFYVETPGDKIRWTYIYYTNGIAINILYPLKNINGRAVGIKISHQTPIPAELINKFKFAKMRSKIATEIRGSYFKIK